jgi:glutaredoxin
MMTVTRPILYTHSAFVKIAAGAPLNQHDVINRHMTADSSKHEQHVLRVQAYLGTAALLLGVALIFLGLIGEMSGGVPFFMPRSWYVNRSLWYFLAMACFVGGGYLLKTQPMSSELWEASQPGIRFRRVVIYTRTDCELCDDAKQMLDGYEKYLPAIQEINIETDQSLIARYGTCVPVIEIDEKVRFRGRLNEMLLRRLIEGTPPLESQQTDS